MNDKFASALDSTLKDEISITENGAVGYKTSGKKLLDMNFSVSSLRNMKETEIEKKFSDAFYENPLLAVKWMFMLRDVRGGMGERHSFRVCFSWLAKVRPDIVKKLIPLVAEYGRFDDLIFSGLEGDLWNDVIDYIDDTWTNDIENMKADKPVSLLAKWLPSINTSSAKTVAMARTIASALKLSEKQYRKTLAKLRAYLNVIEVKMSSKQWDEINYESVPSQANVKYRNAFLRNDETRRRAFLGALEKGEAKINAATNFPSDIVHAYRSHISYNWYSSSKVSYKKDVTLEEMWKALPDYTKGLDTASTIVVADGSGSMGCTLNGTTVTAHDVADALAIYFAEKLNGIFKNKYITFSEKPQLVDFNNATSLVEKIAIAATHNECANTNIEATFDLLLNTAIRNNLKQEDIPANILIVSDMEFDQGTSWGGQTSYWYGGRRDNFDATRNSLFTSITKKWEKAGYKIPRLVFWNVCSRTGTIPVQNNSLGVALVSGFSPSIAKMVFSAKLDPYEVLVNALNEPRYDAVEAAVKDTI